MPATSTWSTFARVSGDASGHCTSDRYFTTDSIAPRSRRGLGEGRSATGGIELGCLLKILGEIDGIFPASMLEYPERDEGAR